MNYECSPLLFYFEKYSWRRTVFDMHLRTLGILIIYILVRDVLKRLLRPLLGSEGRTFWWNWGGWCGEDTCGCMNWCTLRSRASRTLDLPALTVNKKSVRQANPFGRAEFLKLF